MNSYTGTYTGTARGISAAIHNGTLVYPCRCGRDHVDFDEANRHECLHAGDLVSLGPYQVVCGLCGKSWRVQQPTEDWQARD